MKLIVQISCSTLEDAKAQLQKLRKDFAVTKFRIVSQ